MCKAWICILFYGKCYFFKKYKLLISSCLQLCFRLLMKGPETSVRF